MQDTYWCSKDLNRVRRKEKRSWRKLRNMLTKTKLKRKIGNRLMLILLNSLLIQKSFQVNGQPNVKAKTKILQNRTLIQYFNSSKVSENTSLCTHSRYLRKTFLLTRTSQTTITQISTQPKRPQSQKKSSLSRKKVQTCNKRKTKLMLAKSKIKKFTWAII